MKVVVDELRAMDPSPDVILACGFRPQCEQFINYSAQVLYSPKAFNSPVCVDAALINTFGPALEYFSGSVGLFLYSTRTT